MTTTPVQLAFIGAGLFARDAHVPSLLALGETFRVVAVCSRTRESADKLAALLPYSADVLTDVDAVLRREDVEAVNIVMPFDTMPAIVAKALRAGKHVISEKPLAPTVADGRALLDIPLADGQVWMLGENWRYEEAFHAARKMIAEGAIGQPYVFHWTMHIPLTPDNKYYSTAWRRTGTFPGGFLMDGGVHHIAALRLIFGEVASAAAHTTQVRPDLPPADTLAAALRFENGLIGSYTITYAAGSPFSSALYVVGSEGALQIDRHEITLIADGQTTSQAYRLSGVEGELAAFAAAIRRGTPHHNTPLEGLRDVAVIEALLHAAETGQTVVPARV